MPKQQEHKALEDFYAALRSEHGLRTWLEGVGEEFDKLYMWAREGAPDVLEELRRQPEVRSVIKHRAEDACSHATQLGQVTLWISEELLCEGFPRDKSIWVKELIESDRLARRLGVYQTLVKVLSPTYGARRTDPSVERSGWVYLLADAGKVAFHLQDPELAISFFDEAWESRDALPISDLDTAKAVTHIAVTYGMATGYLRDVEGQREPFDIALTRLSEARRLLRDHLPNPDLRPEILQIGIGIGEVWRNLRKREQVGWLTAACRRLDSFHLVEQDLRAAMGMPVIVPRSGAYDPFPSLLPQDRPKAVRVLLDAAGAAEISGEFAVSLNCAQRALALSGSPSDTMRARLQRIRLEGDRTARIDGYEELLREAFGEPNSWPTLDSHVKKQLSDAASEGRKILKHLGRPTASWFWSRLSTEWEQGASTTTETPVRRSRAGWASDLDDASCGWETPADPVAKAKPSSTGNAALQQAAPHGTGDSGDLQALEDRLRTEHTPGLVQTLLGLAYRGGADPPSPALIEQLMKVNECRPAHRGQRADKLPIEHCQSKTDAARVCAEMADEFAQGYAPQYRPEILSCLATNSSLDARQHRAVAEEAYQVSFQAGQPRAAIKAQLELVRSHHHPQYPGVVEGVSRAAAEACNIMHNSLGAVSGAADLIDVAHALTKSSAQLAGLLAHQGYDEWAFKAAHAPLGALSQAFTRNPDLVREFELAESRQHGQTPDADEQLFNMMLDRVKTGEMSSPTRASPRPVEVAAPFGHRVTFVQLLHTPNHGAWALGVEVIDNSCRYWSCPIEANPRWLDRIRDEIANRTIGHGNPEEFCKDLRDLQVKVISPWREQIAEDGTIVFVPHRNFAGLPFHAALGSDGYLVEKIRVGYLPNLEPLAPGTNIPPCAFLGGWNAVINAPDQVDALTPLVEALGFRVEKPRRVETARDFLLDQTGEWGIVHIMAHGNFQQWPLSSTSQLRLTPQVSVNAGEWLHSGCQACLVFLNACTIGRQVPHAGDLNGFPLALRLRGVICEISCSTPVIAQVAHDFAMKFYERLPASDTLTAYQASQKAILREESSMNWVPYFHVGFPISMNQQAAEVQNG
ncbi:CHAT domain-containing protein [Streptomyces sp. CB03578]|uniref:CHAT domain-containing protein n=1 Tax=Streptomyces sp. CB03578 TaxID=1718987 RepID=UPI00093F209A|nr:CHAT domain-containing protein [Streptomyces sp. CB03578]